MVDMTTLNVEKRERAGKGAARAIRREGKVPAVVYGDKKAPLLISITPKELVKEISRAGFWSRQFEITLGKNKHRTVCQDVQFHPVTDIPMHADFLRISKDTILTLEIHVNFINEEECDGLKEGGVLNIVRRELEINCTPDNIPGDIDVDLTGLTIGDAVKMSSITLPEGVTPTITDRDFTIATIAAPTILKDPVDEDEEELEGEDAEILEAAGEEAEGEESEGKTEE